MKIYSIYLALLCPLLTCAQLINDNYCRDVHPDATLWYADFDGDGYTGLGVKCAISRPSGYIANSSGIDCDDTKSSIKGPKTYYLDSDGDNYGDSSRKKVSCSFPSGYTTRGGDCNDDNPNAYITQTYYRDVDGDNYGNSNITKVSCGQPTGYVLKSGDCNDNNPNIHPGLSDGCTIDGIDNNCNGIIDDSKVPTPTLHSITNDCGVTTLRQNLHLTQYEWYWQSSPNGTSTANATTEVERTTGSVYYLRALKKNTNCWSETLTINYTVDPIPGMPAAPTIQENCGNTVLTKPTALQGVTWYWQNSATGTSTATSAASITKSTDGTIYLRGVGGDHCWGNARTVHYSVTQPTQWYEDEDADGFGDPSTSQWACTQPTGYVTNNEDRCPNEYGTKQGCLEALYTDVTFSDQNYIFTQVYQKPMQDVSGIQYNKDVIENIAYYDGLGRPMQQNSIRASNTDQDIITHIAYDAHGRQDKQYLPYEASGAFGSYRSVDIHNDINSYYKTTYPQDFEGVATTNVNAYSESVFEPSPLNRVLEQGAPGAAWKANPNSTEDHTIKFDWNTNTDTEVRYFSVDFINGNTEHPQLVQNGYYAAQELYVTSTKDENWTPADENNHTTKEYKNKLGQVILKRTYNNGESHDTYYVYDDFGNLTFVLPPKVNTQSVSETALSELCYQYIYDYRNRLIEKKIPGKEWESIVYNKLDQPVLTQDAVLQQNGQWLFTKYDAFGRVAYTGILTDSSDRNDLQTELDNFSDALWVLPNSSTTIGGVTMYYNNGGYPNTQNAEVLTVNYYDSYDFLASESTIFNHPNTVYGVTVSDQTKTLPTGTKVKVLETDDWITTATYYDQKSRPIYVVSHNTYLETTDRIETQLDFVGKVLETTTTHTKGSRSPIVTIDSFTYDHMGRLLTQTQTINDQEAELIASNTYDALGQLQSKAVGGSINEHGSPDAPLQNIAYAYNVRGWLTGINDPTNLGNSLFGFKIKYNTPQHGASPLFNGNISETKWATANDHTERYYTYQYDALNRITSGISSDGKYNLNQVTYDKVGNILSLNRTGHLNAAATTFGIMDNLSYTYDHGNKLLKVSDSGNADYGFTDSATQGNDYAYDINGNMILDQNKGITDITYNHLNLPTVVSIASDVGTGNIQYIYDATGTKQKKQVSEGSSLTETEYAGNHVYKNGTLEFFNHPEGYIEPQYNGNFAYTYQYKDHLGNIRLSYKNQRVNTIVDHTFDTNAEGWVTFGGSYTHENGRLRAKVKNKYSAVGYKTYTPFVAGEEIDIRLDMDKLGADVPLTLWMIYKSETGATVGSAILGSVDHGVYTNAHTITKDCDYIELKVGVREALSEDTYFYLDNVSITQGEAGLTIAEEKNYYPFGLQHKGYNNTITGREHPYGYNGKEEQNELGLEWLDFGARNYNASIGRWMNIDPLAEKYQAWSTYHTVYNNPLRYVDPNGMENIVVVGSQNDEGAGNKLMFVNQAIRTMRQWSKDKNEAGESRSMVLFSGGYTNKQIARIKKRVEKFGGTLQLVDSAEGLTNYVNSKDTGSGDLSESRTSDQITNMDIFAHGVTGSIEFGYGTANADSYRLDGSNVSNMNSGAFGSQSEICSYACRTAQGNNMSVVGNDLLLNKSGSLAQKMATVTGAQVLGYAVRTDYQFTLGTWSERRFGFPRSAPTQETIDGAVFLPNGSYHGVKGGDTPVGLTRTQIRFWPKKK